ncbi:unnamed protein product [Spodoptera littoralis]|uniref:Carboxylesterase type B domain-containing protein n=1 Tax=Spodoptera littoralis TaxID=7109 RepID=A0A9P0IAV2_SPOLI|nr:unnamed protein product [Spodoptera littoralis]
MWKCVFSVCLLVSLVLADEEWRLVNITQGPVRGRFEDGTPFNAVDRRIACPQFWLGADEVNIHENCLVANVFVPDTEETNLPVLVNVHGGGYILGYGQQSHFKDLVRSRKIIVLTFNYRLGVHGFLCLGTEGAPGNAGLKDQLAFLRWVKANIASFGGNPNDVTLSACSAGSGSIDFLTLSSLTKGLYTKTIQESGASIGGVGAQVDPIEYAKNYARLLNFHNVDDLDRLEEFYRTAPFELLVSNPDEMLNAKNVNILFGPCVERDLGQERVVTDAPMNIIRQGNYTQVPRIYGFTNMDGAFRLPQFDTWKNDMNERFSDFLPAELHFESEDVREQVAQEVKEFYFGSSPVSEENILSYIAYFTDVIFAVPILKSVSTRIETLGDTIYLFEYSFVDEHTPSFPHTDVRGADHCFQEIAVTDEDVSGRTEEYKQMKEIMRDYWTNFVLTGSPSNPNSPLPYWPPANAQRDPHMSLGSRIELRNDLIQERIAFWDTIYDKYYRGPVVYPSAS